MPSAGSEAQDVPAADRRKRGPRLVNLPAVRRLPLYLGALRRFRADGCGRVSTAELALATGLSDPAVKKDISMLGVTGRARIGYEVKSLIAGIERYLGWDRPRRAVLAGVGGLGTALLCGDGFQPRGLRILAAFDDDPAVLGTRVNGIPVHGLGELSRLAGKLKPEVGVLTASPSRVQPVADLFVAAGITRIWTFAEQALSVPRGVTVQREVLSAGLAELLVRSSRNSGKNIAD